MPARLALSDALASRQRASLGDPAPRQAHRAVRRALRFVALRTDPGNLGSADYLINPLAQFFDAHNRTPHTTDGGKISRRT